MAPTPSRLYYLAELPASVGLAIVVLCGMTGRFSGLPWVGLHVLATALVVATFVINRNAPDRNHLVRGVLGLATGGAAAFALALLTTPAPAENPAAIVYSTRAFSHFTAAIPSGPARPFTDAAKDEGSLTIDKIDSTHAGTGITWSRGTFAERDVNARMIELIRDYGGYGPANVHPIPGTVITTRFSQIKTHRELWASFAQCGGTRIELVTIGRTRIGEIHAAIARSIQCTD